MESLMFILPKDHHCPVSDMILGSLERYLNQGIMPGGFLTAVLENNLAEAIMRADIENRRNIVDIINYVYNEIPSSAWGSREKIEQWLVQFEKAA